MRILGRGIFTPYEHYDWTDHPRKWWWTLRIIIAFLLIGACILLMSRTGFKVSTDNMIYGAVALVTLIRLPKKFKYRKMFKNAIKLVKEQATGNAYGDPDEAYRQYQEEKARVEREQYENRQQQYEQQTHEQPKQDSVKFFTGCVTKEDLDATYKKLATIYHPDQNAGDAEMFKRIQAEYAEEVLKYA